MFKIPYAFAVGSLMYVMVCTYPDIAHSLGVVSRFLVNPSKEHWNEIKWIFRYIKGSIDYCLCFQGTNTLLDGFKYFFFHRGHGF